MAVNQPGRPHSSERRRPGKPVWVAAAAVLIAALAGLAWQFLARPYAMPAVPSGLTASSVGLNLATEQAVYRSAAVGDPAPDPTAGVSAESYVDYLAGKQMLAAGDRRGFERLWAAVRAEPDNLLYGNELRRSHVSLGEWERLTGDWEQVSAPTRRQRLQLALAYIDAMNNPALNDIEMAKLSVQSMNVLDRLIDENPFDFMARYARGVNNLYWPIGLFRGPKATADLGFCVALVEKLELRDPWLDITYAAYGDALVKNGQEQAGFRVWRDGFRRFPESAALGARVRGGTGGSRGLVNRERGLASFRRPEPGLVDLEPIWAAAGQRKER